MRCRSPPPSAAGICSTRCIPCFAGDLGIGVNPKLLARIKGADLVLLLGGRLGELPSQSYTLFDIPEPQMKLVHVHPGADELGHVYNPALAINASPTAFCSALEGLQPPNDIPWRGESDTAHADYLAWSDKATPQPGAVNLGEIMVWLREHLPADAILTQGAGNFAGWVHRFYRVRKYNGLIGATSGSMGYGLPAALGLQTLYPKRTVVCVAGDGDFLMTGQDFATCVQYELPVIVLVCDNGLYGTIRMHQEREYPGRVVATELRNPDFVAYAKAFGGFGVRVDKTADFPAAFAAAQQIRPAVDRASEDRPGGAHARHVALRYPREGIVRQKLSLPRGGESEFIASRCPIAAPKMSSVGLPRASRRFSMPRPHSRLRAE